MFEISGKRFQPPFVHFVRPPKEEDDDELFHIKSGGGAAGVKLFKSQAEVKALFGGLPHEFKDSIEIDPITHSEVKKFESKGNLKGFYVCKPIKFGHDFHSTVEQAKSDLRTNRIGNRFFSSLDLGNETHKPFIFPDQVAYTASVYDTDLKANEKKVFIVSKYIPCSTSPFYFNSWGPRLRAWSAPLAYIFGLGDNKDENIPTCLEATYPKVVSFYESTTAMRLQNLPAHAFIDTGEIFDHPRAFTLQSAKVEISSGYVPWIDSKGNNNLDLFLKEFEVWRDRIKDDSFLTEYFEICKQAGMSRKDAETFLKKVIIPNIEGYERNLDMLCSAGNDQIPKCVLKDLKDSKLIGNSEFSKTEKISLDETTVISRNEHPSFILDLNDGMLVSVTSDTGTRIRVKNLFPKKGREEGEKEILKEVIVNEGHPLVIGSSGPFGTGSSIAMAHIMLTNMGDRVHIRNLQEIPDRKKPTHLWISKES